MATPIAFEFSFGWAANDGLEVIEYPDGVRNGAPFPGSKLASSFATSRGRFESGDVSPQFAAAMRAAGLAWGGFFG